MNNNPSRSDTISPLSMNSNDSSFVSRYQGMNTPNSDAPYSGGPYGAARPAQMSPPMSQHPSSSTDNSLGRPSASSRSTSMSNRHASTSSSVSGPGGFSGPPSDNGRSHKPGQEEALQEHYRVLKTYLATYLRDEKGNARPNRARDKLLRLSVTQFQELSTDVYDELRRREDDRLQRVRDVPRFLLPKPNFHPKRNQARQKLSTLPIERFRQLATDVFYELERRVPRFAAEGLDRHPSPAVSMAGSNRAPSRNGMGPPNGMPRGPPPPGGFRGGPSPGPRPPGPGGPSYMSFRPESPGPNANGPPGPPRNRSESNSSANSYGRPLPKTFQSNTIVPNKSTMVEDDETEEDEDAFALDKVVNGLGQRDSEGSGAQLAEIAELKSKIEELENRLLDKESELQKVRLESKNGEDNISNERNEWFDLREELEQKVTDVEQLNANMKKELDTIRQSGSKSEREILDRHERITAELRSQHEHKLANVKSQHKRDLSELRQRHEGYAEDHKAQVEDVHAENDSLRAQLEDHLRTHEVLQRQIEDHRAENEDLRCQVQSNPQMEDSDDMQALREELANQEKITNQVRQEATEYLYEMRELSRQSDVAMEREEQLATQVSHLEKEIDQWKTRYAKVRAQNRTLRASTMGLPLQLFDSGIAHDREGMRSGSGIVKDTDVTRFQMAVDELLQSARQPSNEALLESVKSVVVCVRNITSDIDVAEYPTPSPSPSSPHPTTANGVEPSTGKLKARVTGTANSLITAVKQHASSHGLSPVSLLDAAASNLTAAVVELIKAVGVKQTPRDELHDDTDSFYDDRPSLDDANGSNGHMAANATPAPLSLGRKDTTAKKANGWFSRWGQKSVDERAEEAPSDDEDYDPYR